MNATENTPQVRLLTPAELAVCIKVFRDARQWSQEQLAVISGLNVRTVQRVEQGWPAGPDTCRALASAFDFADIEALNKPFAIPPEDELKAAQEQFDQEHVTLAAIPLTTGKQLAKLAETCTIVMSELAFETGREAAKRFAALMEYRDVVLGALLDLPRAPLATPEETFYPIEREGLFNRGIGYVDTSLLASARLQPGITIWTRDKRLKKVADELNLGAVLAH